MQDQVKVLKITNDNMVSTNQLGATFGAIMIGGFLLFASGFAQATIVHDSAHDLRHSMAFPCH
jgi:cobalt transporter subunit CbtB